MESTKGTRKDLQDKPEKSKSMVVWTFSMLRDEGKDKLIETLQEHGTIFIFSERIPPIKITVAEIS